VSVGHPEGLPDLFLDRSLGRRQVPELLRGAGLRLHTLAEVYGIPADEGVPAVNAHGGFGRWRFLEIKDPYECRQDLLTALTFEPLVPV
jgi:hypothetical protein